jgi:cytochrome bd-type quinol oxidase subunit 1
MMGLLFSTGGFLLLGAANGVSYPAYVWNVPIGTATFIIAIAVDTIGHRTRYKERLDQGEGFVHAITIFLGVTSVLCLCLAYSHPDFFRVPAMVLIGLSIFYSAIDEWMHWKRYMESESDRVEMWSHVFIMLGHITMSLAWWHWFDQGYPGVAETLRFL